MVVNGSWSGMVVAVMEAMRSVRVVRRAMMQERDMLAKTNLVRSGELSGQI